MKNSLKISLALATLLGAVAAPAVAGNYAEGDPRPAPITSNTSRAAVASETQAWLQTSPDLGYPDAGARAVERVSANSRAMVQADTANWMRSGLAAATNGDGGSDMTRPVYRRAAAEYDRLRVASQANGSATASR